MNDFKDIKIAVAGTGYVGLSIATLLSQHHHVTAVDVIPEKVRLHPRFLRKRGLGRKWSSPCRRDGEVEKTPSLTVRKDG